VFCAFLRLGLTSFGGPVAHLAYFHREFVLQRKWLDEQRYADLLALCQFLPGPASSQLGYAIGLQRGGIFGGIAAWLGFTLPSALIMLACASGLGYMQGSLYERLLQGLLILAAAVVAHAVHGMARKLAPDLPRALIAILATLVMYIHPQAWLQVLLIAIGALLGRLLLRPAGVLIEPGEASALSRQTSRYPLALPLYCLLLTGLPLSLLLTDNPLLRLTEAFYRSGALVFGGGHVVLPLLQNAIVEPGWMDESTFLAGYGAAQALPGPLFSFAAYLGASQSLLPGGAWTGLLALVCIFLPGLLLLTGLLPHWERLRAIPGIQRALAGSNAVVVGLLLAALMNPVLPKAIHSMWDAALSMLALALLLLKRPLWLVMALCLIGALLIPR
jgi:chromate transporter